MSGPIVVIDSSEIREGKLEELKTALKELAAFVEADDPRHEDYRGSVSQFRQVWASAQLSRFGGKATGTPGAVIRPPGR